MKRVYPIVNLDRGEELREEFVRWLFSFDPRWLQIRMKNSPHKELVSCAQRLIELRDAAGVATRIIVNDSIDAALEAGADGVHLGQEDLSELGGKRLPKGLEIGISTHNLEQVRVANRLDIAYIGFGPVFKTSTKDTKNREVFPIAKEAAALSTHPIVFIGGLDLENIASLPQGDSIFYAAISALEAEFLKIQ
ncbi:thiamine phosphate synthase [bacterium]|nr:thiamine phosphate synthase [bacterium]